MDTPHPKSASTSIEPSGSSLAGTRPSTVVVSVGKGRQHEVDISHVLEFLPCPTPQAWIEAAKGQQTVMLIDHANCEKKAASTAVNLTHRYIDNDKLLNKMSRLAREELRHFEQVIRIMKKRGIAYKPVTASRYANGLHGLVRKQEPHRLVDILLIGALIEARSCERFAALIPVLDDELAKFYGSLLRSESRHFTDYLGLAAELASDEEIEARLALLKEKERELVESEDTEFRFHSGVPAVGAGR